ncbi:MAG: hypothetical protein OXG64_05985 [Chloroflexi bacterium]|nr:hypothetical protein [Chloroflexota bacterium]
MTVDPAVLPGLLFFMLQLIALAVFGVVVARAALRQTEDGVALAQGVVIGPALWGLCVNSVLPVFPGTAAAAIGWVVILVVGAALVRHAPQTLRMSPRTLATFTAATVALFWAMLASRQLLKVPDPELHLWLSAYIQAGGWPPITSWNPESPAYYHHGVDLLVGLLTPPVGPNSVFVTELIGAYAWTGFALLVAVALLKRSGWLIALTLSLLLLTDGSWTLHGAELPNILQIPVLTEVPSSKLVASLGDLYWPEIPSLWESKLGGAPDNIWKPPFVLAYALAFIVLWYAASGQDQSRLGALTLAALIGFQGILSEELALLVIVLWIGLIASHIVPHLASRPTSWTVLRSTILGPVAAALLLAFSGGGLTAILSGEPRSDISIGWIHDPLDRQTLGRFETLPEGIGLLGIGAVTIATVASLLAWRDRLVVALVAGSLACMAAALTITYETSPIDVTRFDGHARNLALLALLLALADRLPGLRPRWRFAASTVVVALIVWPTVARPAHTIAAGIGRGLELSNPQPGVLSTDANPYHHDLRRFAMDHQVSDQVVSYIRNNTTVDALILSPYPVEMSIATGRPNASGLAGHVHLLHVEGAQYTDALRYLEPRAIRRRGFSYVHATQAWVERLPDHARQWLSSPHLFEQLARSESDALYLIKPEFLLLNDIYDFNSYENLRQAIPASSSVYLPPGILPKVGLRIAASLSHTRLFGSVDKSNIHRLTDFPIQPLGSGYPDFVVVPSQMAPAAFAPTVRRPVWWNHEVAVYAPGGAVSPVVPPPPRDFSIQLSDVQVAERSLAFTATFTDRATDRWQGQDWVVIATDDSPWRVPYRFETDSFTSGFARWFDGQVQPQPEGPPHEYLFLYQFEPLTGTLAVWDGRGYASLSSPQPPLQPGRWILAARPNINREEVGLIPVLQFTLTDDESVTYKTYEGSLDAMLIR